MQLYPGYENFMRDFGNARRDLPIGPQPEHIWREHRVKHLLEAMSRKGHKWADMAIWCGELHEHILWLLNREENP